MNKRKFGRLDVLVSIINDDGQRRLMPAKSADSSLQLANTLAVAEVPSGTSGTRSVGGCASLVVGNYGKNLCNSLASVSGSCCCCCYTIKQDNDGGRQRSYVISFCDDVISWTEALRFAQ